METDLKELREKIDRIDDKIVELYLKRMEVVSLVAQKKRELNSPVTDAERESKILYRLTKNLPDEFKIYLKEVYSAIFTTSKAYQAKKTGVKGETAKRLSLALKDGQKQFPASAAVACQGVEGSNSRAAARKLFPILDISYFKTFEGVFSAVDKGFCEYGILPIENSTAGSVNEVYDLMKKYDFCIVRSVRLKINHCLCAVSGVELKDVKRVVSHPQALSQCEKYLSKRGFDIVAAENTATAAKNLAESKDAHTAVLCSEDCAAIYGLKILERAVQNSSANYTRFICIGKKTEVFAESNKISVMTSLKHEPGSLNKILARFSALGLDLTKIESRPIESSPFEFMFYFDFDGNVADEKVVSLISDMEADSDKFTFLGCYREII
ncbi:MAG: chorismate mutase [Clostridia bacterium]|nr:chorismate mutase [Clostridia bacterium]